MLNRFDGSVGGQIFSFYKIAESSCLFGYLTSLIWLLKSVMSKGCFDRSAATFSDKVVFPTETSSTSFLL